jgi:hypothetical protein
MPSLVQKLYQNGAVAFLVAIFERESNIKTIQTLLQCAERWSWWSWCIKIKGSALLKIEIKKNGAEISAHQLIPECNYSFDSVLRFQKRVLSLHYIYPI